jgi:uncharacterized protein
MVRFMDGDRFQVGRQKFCFQEPVIPARQCRFFSGLRNLGVALLRHLNKLIEEMHAIHQLHGLFQARVVAVVLMVSIGLSSSACGLTRLPTPLPNISPTPTPSPIGWEILPTLGEEMLATSMPLVSTQQATPAPTSTANSLPPTSPPVYTPTPDLYGEFSIAHLSSRSYGGGLIQVHEILQDDPTFTRFLFSYPSDGLTIYGFLNVPKHGGPFPVVIALHGYIDPAIYDTIDYTTPYADILARAGYLVFHPNLRGYSPSDSGPNLFRVGMAVDVLNLISLIKEQAGSPGPLEAARAEGFGLWGHSMGGGISLRVAILSPDIRVAVLYAAMSGDERRNYEAIAGWSGYQRGLEELGIPEVELLRISPIYYLDQISAKISIHHGEQDQMVPLEWSRELYQQLSQLGKDVEYVTYPGQPHTFNASGRDLFMQKVIELFDQELK